MKQFFLVLLAFFIAGQGWSQYPKIIVQFTNKGDNTFSLANASQYLSSRSVQRRTKQAIAIDSADLPITPRYIDSIRLAGNVVILSKSKWLNQILIQTTDATALAKIQNFPFVKKMTGVGYRLLSTQAPPHDKFNERYLPANPSPLTSQRTLGDLINYGNSYAQVHIHEGEFLHNKGYRGENMQIAVLDGGFRQYKTNTAFDSIRLNNQVLGERDFVNFDNSVNEDDMHGANCLSILSANWPGRMVGTAPNASYWLLRTENVVSEYPIEEHNWVVGAEFADSSGADMISSSLGYYDFDDPAFNHSYSQFYKNATTVTMGATMAAKKGMIVMNSAGNEGNSAWKYQGFPADADSVCAVGAVNASGQIASFSSYGYPGKVKPNIVSVGAGTVLAGSNNQPVTGNGTSYSNPNVAGLIACLWQAFPTFKNMEILDAVYKSADRYTVPTDRYGYGIPNFKTAYRLLKRQVNTQTFGPNWLVATPNPFTNRIDATFVGQVDGNAKLDLINAAGQVVLSAPLLTEKEEVYNYNFSNLESLPAGTYSVKYSDSLNSRSVNVQKAGAINGDWLRLIPGNVFINNINITFTPPETGTIAFRIIDAKGSKISERQLTTTQGQNQTMEFNLRAAAKGVYFLQYISKTQQRVIRLIKL
jgi:serine protease AprX